MSPSPDTLMRVNGISKSFPLHRGTRIQALDGLSFQIERGEILGLLGASGSGKTTAARVMTGLEKTDAGEVYYDGAELTSLSPRERRKLCPEIQMIFQDPYSSMSRRRRIVDIVAEPLRIQGRPKPHQEIVRDMLHQVGIPAGFMHRYPFELSGGERQRVAIARAFVLGPRFVVADEIVSMLDSSCKIQILHLLLRLRSERGVSMLFITHDVAVAAHICDRIAVLKDGHIVESGDTAQILECPREPYTIALIEAVPTL